MVQCLGRSGPGLQLGTRRQLARTGRAADSAIGAVRRHEVFLRFPTERNRPTLYIVLTRACRTRFLLRRRLRAAAVSMGMGRARRQYASMTPWLHESLDA